MKHVVILIVTILVTHFSRAQTIELQDFRWKNRLLIIYSGKENQAQLKKQLQYVDQEIAAYEERDIKIILLQNNKAWVWNTLENTEMDFQKIAKGVNLDLSSPYQNFLIGKDGGIKMTSKSAFSHQELFNTIDSMPMRRQEMRNQKQ